MDVKVHISEDGKVYARTPFDQSFVSGAKNLKGSWDGATKSWVFDPRDEQRVRDLCKRIFGTDGDPVEAGDLVTVRVRLTDHESPNLYDNFATFAGRRIAHRPGRDDPIKLAANVVLIKGTLPTSGGSQRYPRIIAGDDVIVEIRDIPRVTLDMENENSYEIVEEKKEIDREALVVELAKLAARMEEIVKILESIDE